MGIRVEVTKATGSHRKGAELGFANVAAANKVLGKGNYKVTANADGTPYEASNVESVPSLDWTREELNAHAEQLGVESPDALPNKQAVLEAVEERLTAPDDEDASDSDAEPDAEGGE